MIALAPRRAAVYGIVGCVMEASFTTAVATLGAGERRLHGPSTPLMLPLYGFAQPLFEPLHDAVRGRPAWQRGAVYAVCALAAEGASGWLLRRLTGTCPWDYTGRSRLSVAGVVRLDYGPLWAVAGLAAERLDDRLRAGRAVRTGTRGRSGGGDRAGRSRGERDVALRCPTGG